MAESVDLFPVIDWIMNTNHVRACGLQSMPNEIFKDVLLLLDM
jgi:hypothetical protein